MNVPSDSTAPRRSLREWWLTPARPGLQRLINPWEYRHLGVCGITRIAGGSLGGAAGIICLAYGVYGWAVFFLVLAALNVGGGWWYISIDRTAAART